MNDYDKLIQEIKERTGLSEQIITNTYKVYWKSIRAMIEDLDLKTYTDSFNPVSFNIPSLGKLHCSKEKYYKKHKQYNYIKDIINNDKYKED